MSSIPIRSGIERRAHAMEEEAAPPGGIAGLLDHFRFSLNRGILYLFVFTQFRTQNRCALLLELL